ncbi:hypothetical protein BJ508DRAFT_414151 [Ascobolus immersus RN42]|uniref:Uncharacterized protein n=1 Tax=Ascobolus immersus RN42 TaxID=1160509 RepID=A0A3N4IA09_ASCIM|nr:hypothetical protein BJ508DRAFT_414151 [Ascobolus immersus RN42]
MTTISRANSITRRKKDPHRNPKPVRRSRNFDTLEQIGKQHDILPLAVKIYPSSPTLPLQIAMQDFFDHSTPWHSIPTTDDRHNNERKRMEREMQYHLRGIDEDNFKIPPLLETFRVCTAFFFEELHPYLCLFPPTPERRDGGIYGVKYHIREAWIGCMRYHGKFLQERWDAGLVRDGLVRLLKGTFDAMIRQVRAVITAEGSDKKIMVKVGFYVRLLRFLSDEFRSERLEALMLRYLDEDDSEQSGIIVVEAVEKESAIFTMGFEGTERIYKCLSPGFKHLDMETRMSVYGVPHTEYVERLYGNRRKRWEGLPYDGMYTQLNT